MLPRQHRLSDSRAFALTVRRGRRLPAPSVVGHLLTRPGNSDAAQIGLIVSKRVGNSVQRHRVSRRLRHAAAGGIDLLPPGSQLVLRALPGASARGADLAGDVAAILQRAALQRAAR